MKTVVKANNNSSNSSTNNNPNLPTTIVTKIEPGLEDELINNNNNNSNTSIGNSTTNNNTTTTSTALPHFQAPNQINNPLLNGSKRPATLNIKPLQTNKKPRLVTTLSLETPDLSMATPNTPDVEKIILSIQTPQPQSSLFPNKQSSVTTEQEDFSKGFEEALNNLHTKETQSQFTNVVEANPSSNAEQQQEAMGGKGFVDSMHSLQNKKPLAAPPTSSNGALGSMPIVPRVVATTATSGTNIPTSIISPAGTGMSGGSFTYTNLDPTFPVAIKDEPPNGPASPPVSPIDMETQEKIKLERKRQRNRVAASKCRKRKLERISKLEDKVKALKGENVDLGGVVKQLKEHVAQLKQQVIDHVQSGCSIDAVNCTTSLIHGK